MTESKLPILIHRPAQPGAGIWGDDPPDAVSLEALYRGLMLRRVLAYLVDLMVIAVLLSLAGVIFFFAGVLSFGLLTPLLAAVFLLIPFAYHTLLIGGEKSATYGMRFFDVEVRGWIGGRRPDYLQSAVMTALFFLSIGTLWLILIVALFNPRHRTLHDMLSGMVAVRSSALDEFKPQTADPSP